MSVPAVAAPLAPHVHAANRQLADGADRKGRQVARGGSAAAAHVHARRALVEGVYPFVMALLDHLIGKAKELQRLQPLHVCNLMPEHACLGREIWRDG